MLFYTYSYHDADTIFQLCQHLAPPLPIPFVICLIRLLEHNLPGQIFSHIFLFKPCLYEKERLHTLRVPYTVFLYPSFDCFISTAPATVFPLISDTSFPSFPSYESGPGYAHPHWQGGRKSHSPARLPAYGSRLFPSSSLPPVCPICTVQTSLPP